MNTDIETIMPALGSLLEVTKRLHSADDEIALYIRAVENFLTENGIPGSDPIDIGSYPNHPSHLLTVRFARYTPSGKEGRRVAIQVMVPCDDFFEWTNLANCRVLVRARVAEKMPELLEKLTRNISGIAVQAERTAAGLK